MAEDTSHTNNIHNSTVLTFIYDRNMGSKSKSIVHGFRPLSYLPANPDNFKFALRAVMSIINFLRGTPCGTVDCSPSPSAGIAWDVSATASLLLVTEEG